MGCGASTLEQSGASLTRTESLLRDVMSAREQREAQSASVSPLLPASPVSTTPRDPTPSPLMVQRHRQQHTPLHATTPTSSMRCDSVMEHMILTQNLSPLRLRGTTESASPTASGCGGSVLCFGGSRSVNGERSPFASVCSFERCGVQEDEQAAPHVGGQPSEPSRADNDDDAADIDFPALSMAATD